MRAITFVCASAFYTHVMWGQVSALRKVTGKAVEGGHHSLSNPGHEQEHDHEHDHDHASLLLRSVEEGGAQERAPALWTIDYNGNCFDQSFSSRRNVYGYPCHGADNQQFYFRDGRIHNLYLGRGWCLDMDFGGGQKLYMNRCHGGWNQLFHMHGRQIRNAAGCVDQNFGDNQLYIHYCHGGSNQQFEIGGVVTVRGKWQPLHALQKETEYTFKHGTTKTQSVTKSSEWSSSVTGSVNKGFFGVSATLATKLVSSHEKEWSVSETLSVRQLFEFVKGRQMYLWQWQYEVGTSTAETVMTKTLDYALTAGRWEGPKCAPGYCKDQPRCQVCESPGKLS